MNKEEIKAHAGELAEEHIKLIAQDIFSELQKKDLILQREVARMKTEKKYLVILEDQKNTPQVLHAFDKEKYAEAVLKDLQVKLKAFDDEQMKTNPNNVSFAGNLSREKVEGIVSALLDMSHNADTGFEFSAQKIWNDHYAIRLWKKGNRSKTTALYIFDTAEEAQKIIKHAIEKIQQPNSAPTLAEDPHYYAGILSPEKVERIAREMKNMMDEQQLLADMLTEEDDFGHFIISLNDENGNNSVTYSFDTETEAEKVLKKLLEKIETNQNN